MEDIYDDLDNYNDVNSVQELRNENTELKVKLEEYATAMEKLQKDYDNLEMEFKKLENNYSSLLKTARAEIERKTQRISQLNMEKDQMVLSSLQNGRTIRRHFNKGAQNWSKINNEKPVQGKAKDDVKMKNNNTKNDRCEIQVHAKTKDHVPYPTSDNRSNLVNKFEYAGTKVEICNNMKTKDDVKMKNINTKNDRCEIQVHAKTKDHIPYPASDNRSNLVNKFEYTGTKVETCNNMKSNVKENLVHCKTDYNDTSKTPASSIKNRRKSMPSASMPEDIFSSDEELKKNYPSNDSRTDAPLTHKLERRNDKSKISFERHSNKISETSSMGDKGSHYHESTLRETYRGRPSNHFDNNSYRGKDKYDVAPRYRKHYSPDRGHRRQYREYQEGYYRQEHGRYRPLESPPPETFNRHQRRNQDAPSTYDRYTHDHEKYNHRYEEKHAAKHRMSNNYNEPESKRQKRESFDKPNMHINEDKRYYEDKEFIDMQSFSRFSPHEYDTLRPSCQSPDYVHTDEAFVHPIREIRTTAVTPLEDPRVTSKRYVIKNENDKKTLSTTVDRPIDFKSVDKTKWEFKHVNIPKALVRRPSQCSEDFVKALYMGIDNPVINQSMESGEVCFESGDETVEYHNRKENRIRNTIQDHDINKQAIEEISNQATKSENIMNTEYRIPKISKSNKNSQGKMDPVIGVGDKNVDEKATEEHYLRKILTRQRQNTVYENHTSSGVSDNQHAEKSESNSNKNTQSQMDFSIIGVDNNRKVNEKATDDNCLEKSLTRQHNAVNENHLSSNISDKQQPKRNESQTQLTLSNIAIGIVANDLELSDDNSDNMDTHRQKVTEKLVKSCKVQSNIKEVSKKEDSANNLDDKSCNKSFPDSKVDTAVINTIEVDEKIKECDSTKKQKSKKKKSKSKEVSSKDLTDSKDASQLTEKKTRSKKEKDSKPKEILNKFSDLFGDSCSLMTPEDLGIPSYLPISEDAQDAVDIKINQMNDAPLPKQNLEIPDFMVQNCSDIKKPETLYDNNLENILHKSNTEHKEMMEDNKKKKSSRMKEENINSNKIMPSDGYENLNPETDLNQLNVVKTVIISTGVQPKLTLDNNCENVLEKPTVDVIVNAKQMIGDIYTVPAVMEFKKQDLMKALATSTPQKEFTTVKTLETSSRTSVIICDSNDNISKTIESGDNTEQIVDQSATNSLDSDDAPDVRIFVKRRRKVVKRPQMT